MDWCAIWQQHHRDIVGYFYRRISDLATSEDLAAQTFVKALEAERAGKGPESHLTGWLYRIAHNLLVDFYRERDRKKVADLEELDKWMPRRAGFFDDGGLAELCAESELWGRLNRATRSLTDQQQSVIVMRSQGYKLKEIADGLSMSEESVKGFLQRGLQNMRVMLAVE